MISFCSLADGETYRCSSCHEHFQYPNSLRAHITFRCVHALNQRREKRDYLQLYRNVYSGSNAVRLPLFNSFNGVFDMTKVRSSNHIADHPNVFPFNFYNVEGRSLPWDALSNGTLQSNIPTDLSRMNGMLDCKMYPWSRIFPTMSSNLCPFNEISQNTVLPQQVKVVDLSTSSANPSEENCVSSSDVFSQIKRKLFDSDTSSSASKHFRPHKPFVEQDDSDKNQNCWQTSYKTDIQNTCSKKCFLTDTGSAFKKVEKKESFKSSSLLNENFISVSENLRNPTKEDNICRTSSLTTKTKANICKIKAMSTVDSSVVQVVTGTPSSHLDVYMPPVRESRGPTSRGFFALPPSAPMHHINTHHPAFAAADQIPPGLLDLCQAAIPSIGPLTENLSIVSRSGNACIPLTSSRNGNMLIEAYANERGNNGRNGFGALPFFKPQNPMVEKILQSASPVLVTAPMSAINISQNWCAKCNATFRMTSDLVYHMRSHHKREFDPMKRKREEKLKCSICSETFRERHHLTRHMSSHD